jgi:transposase
VLSGILFVLSTGIAWRRLPQELGFGSGMTCWRRLRDWQQAGVFERVVLNRPIWSGIAEIARREFNDRLKAAKVVTGRWHTGINLVDRLLGKELCVLACELLATATSSRAVRELTAGHRRGDLSAQTAAKRSPQTSSCSA